MKLLKTFTFFLLGIFVMFSYSSLAAQTKPQKTKQQSQSKATTAQPVILIPQKSKAQIDSMAAPESGTVLFNTTTKKAQYFDGKGWQNFTKTQHYVGEVYGGGIVFYTDASREHGLIAAPEDMPELVKWGPDDKITGATDKAIGAGKANTEKIIATNDTLAVAAKLCADYEANGFSDWYLPTLKEWTELYNNLVAKGWGNFKGELYWTSSETDFNNAWIYNIKRGVSTEKNISKTLSVRAVRSF